MLGVLRRTLPSWSDSYAPMNQEPCNRRLDAFAMLERVLLQINRCTQSEISTKGYLQQAACAWVQWLC